MVNRFLCLLSAALCCLSCMEEQQYPAAEPNNASPVPSIRMRFSDGFKVPEGSRVAVFKAVPEGRYFNYVPQGGGMFAYAGEGDAPSAPAFAVYPPTAVDSIYRGQLYLQVAEVQQASKDAADTSAFVYAGRVSADSCVLHPLTAVLSFTVQQEDIAACVISSSGKSVGGPAKAALYSVPEVSAVSNSAGSVRLEGGMEKGGTYGAVVAAEDYAEFDVTLYNSCGVQVHSQKLVGDYALSGRSSAFVGAVGNPDISSLTLQVRTNEFAGYTLKSVAVYSASEGRRIMGAEVGKAMQADSALDIVFYGLEAADYSADKLWYVYTLEKGADSVVLPVEMDGVNVAPGSSLMVDGGILSESRNAARWFYPHEDRRLKSGAGYAFGEANTFLIQYKQSVYDGGAVDADPSIADTVVIDYRVRGDLFAAPRPVGVTFEWMTWVDGANRYTMDRSKVSDCHNYEFDVDTAAFRVTVRNVGAHVGSPILLMKKDGVVLWAWTFWNIAADGTRLQAVPFGGAHLANMDIGHPSTQLQRLAKVLGQVRRSTNYYQWGRPIPTFFNDGTGIYLSQNDARNAAKPRVPVYDAGAVSVEDALRHPGYLVQNSYVSGSASGALADWIADGSARHKDLWGASSSSDTSGIKSIYDPCPKGWRVPDAATYLEVFPQAVEAYDTLVYRPENASGCQGVYIGEGLLFVTSGYYDTSTDKYGYVASLGVNAAEKTTAGNAGLFWTNTPGSASSSACAFHADYKYERYNRVTEFTGRSIKVENQVVGRALPVRCQTDTDNR